MTSWKEVTGSKMTDGSKWLDPSAYQTSAKEDLSYSYVSVTLTYPMLDRKNNLRSLPVKERQIPVLWLFYFSILFWGIMGMVKQINKQTHNKTPKKQHTVNTSLAQ